jgi:hypothetical protein
MPAGKIVALIALGVSAMAAENTQLNHFYVVLDHETYAAIEANAFLKKEFASFEKRTTVRRDSTYTGIYFYGSNTYFEFFDESTEKRKLGESGIAFGVDETGAMPKPPLSKSGEITREWNGKQVPWFQRLSPSAPVAPGIETWVMEYLPHFLEEWRPELGEGKGVSRAEVLKRYKKALPENPASPMLEDVIGLTIALEPREIDTFSMWNSAIRTRFPITFVPVKDGTRGIRRVQFRLRRPPPTNMLMMFGPRSNLTLRADGTATWDF